MSSWKVASLINLFCTDLFFSLGRKPWLVFKHLCNLRPATKIECLTSINEIKNTCLKWVDYLGGSLLSMAPDSIDNNCNKLNLYGHSFNWVKTGSLLIAMFVIGMWQYNLSQNKKSKNIKQAPVGSKRCYPAGSSIISSQCYIMKDTCVVKHLNLWRCVELTDPLRILAMEPIVPNIKVFFTSSISNLKLQL